MKSDRFGNNKFKINVTTQVMEKATFIDTLFGELVQAQVAQKMIDKFSELILTEEYDSDAIVADVMNYADGSNVINIINHRKTNTVILDFIVDVQSMFDLPL